MKSDYWERRREDERLHADWRGKDYAGVLRALLEERGIRICQHGEMTTYQPCAECDRELDEEGL